MTESSALSSRARIRQDRRHKTTLAVLATTVTLALAAPGTALAAPGPAAAAAPVTTAVDAAPTPIRVGVPTKVKKVKPKLKVKRSAARQVRGETRVKLTISAKHRGKNLPGKAEIRVGKKLLKTKKVTKGKATYKLPTKLKRGTKKIKVTFRPGAKTATTAAGRGKTLTPTSRTVRVKVITQGEAIKREALKHVGTRYRYGGTSPRTGFDCSGFVSYVYKKAGIAKLPRSSSSQRHVGKVVSRSKAKVGDIIWSPGHVGIYLGGNKQIDAPRPGKTIQVRSIWQSNPLFINV